MNLLEEKIYNVIPFFFILNFEKEHFNDKSDLAFKAPFVT